MLVEVLVGFVVEIEAEVWFDVPYVVVSVVVEVDAVAAAAMVEDCAMMFAVVFADVLYFINIELLVLFCCDFD